MKKKQKKLWYLYKIHPSAIWGIDIIRQHLVKAGKATKPEDKDLEVEIIKDNTLKIYIQDLNKIEVFTFGMLTASLEFQVMAGILTGDGELPDAVYIGDPDNDVIITKW